MYGNEFWRFFKLKEREIMASFVVYFILIIYITLFSNNTYNDYKKLKGWMHKLHSRFLGKWYEKQLPHIKNQVFKYLYDNLFLQALIQCIRTYLVIFKVTLRLLIETKDSGY